MVGNEYEEAEIIKQEFLDYKNDHQFENYQYFMKEFQISKMEVEKSILNYYLEKSEESNKTLKENQQKEKEKLQQQPELTPSIDLEDVSKIEKKEKRSKNRSPKNKSKESSIEFTPEINDISPVKPLNTEKEEEKLSSPEKIKKTTTTMMKSKKQDELLTTPKKRSRLEVTEPSPKNVQNYENKKVKKKAFTFTKMLNATKPPTLKKKK
eukprot:gene7025-11190_t